jgi:AcrR family transcriptional regulator
MPRQPSRKRRPDARPAEILAAALELFAARGFAATRMEDVAAAAGLSKAAIYLYFPDKLALLAGVVDGALQANLAGIAAAMHGHEGQAAPLLRRFLLTLATLLRTSRFPDLAKLIIAESRAHPEIGRLWLDHVIAHAFPLVRGLIERGVAAGEFRTVDSAMTARCVVAPMLLAALWRSVFEPLGGAVLDIEALAAHHADLLLHGLAVRS